jgi:hypothetical protein
MGPTDTPAGDVSLAETTPRSETLPAPRSTEAGDRVSTAPSEQVVGRLAAERDPEALERPLAGDRDAAAPVVHPEVDGVRLRLSTDGVAIADRRRVDSPHGHRDGRTRAWCDDTPHRVRRLLAGGRHVR